MTADIKLGETARAIARHDMIVPRGFATTTADISAYHLLGVAQAFNRIGDDVGAARVLIEASRLAPDEIRYQSTEYTVARDIVRTNAGRVPPGLAELAEVPSRAAVASVGLDGRATPLGPSPVG